MTVECMAYDLHFLLQFSTTTLVDLGHAIESTQPLHYIRYTITVAAVG
jgi:hypothetical protein